mmetsp:Transcript_12458/g.22637  ORF Transcript_12458/g.22637 Transcript_12458/m.22637 type:complete len:117 (-) Transcript_12458:807-1157(-)
MKVAAFLKKIPTAPTNLECATRKTIVLRPLNKANAINPIWIILNYASCLKIGKLSFSRRGCFKLSCPNYNICKCQPQVVVETGSPNAALNFYDPNTPFDYGTAGGMMLRHLSLLLK